jgi:hypothetical protein
MATNCSEGVYTISYTDTDTQPITINKLTLNQSTLDIALLGQGRTEYGQVFDENILHLLENFASDEDPNNPGNPDPANNYGNLLSYPTKGQKWYNKTQNRLFTYDGSAWHGMGNIDDVAGNFGIIAHGAYLPRPISPITGYEFTYEECSWVVSMWNFSDQTQNAICTTNSSGLVTSQYTVAGSPYVTNGYAFYQIIGIRGNSSNTLPSPTPTPTPTLTPTISTTVTPTPSITMTRTPVASLTPTPSASSTPAVSVTPSRTPAVSATPTQTPVPSSSSTPAPSVTPTPTPPITPTSFMACSECVDFCLERGGVNQLDPGTGAPGSGLCWCKDGVEVQCTGAA